MTEATTVKRQWRVWSAKEDLDVFRLKPDVFARIYGRTLAAIHARREYLREGRDYKKGVELQLEPTKLIVPRDVIAERDERLAKAPRDLTAAFAGDPLPGHSALDKYHRDLVSA